MYSHPWMRWHFPMNGDPYPMGYNSWTLSPRCHGRKSTKLGPGVSCVMNRFARSAGLYYIYIGLTDLLEKISITPPSLLLSTEIDDVSHLFPSCPTPSLKERRCLSLNSVFNPIWCSIGASLVGSAPYDTVGSNI